MPSPSSRTKSFLIRRLSCAPARCQKSCAAWSVRTSPYDNSDAPLARDLRILLRERLRTGDTDQQVLDFLVARYGEFVLLRPPFSSHTAVLWLTPAGILVVGAISLYFLWRRRAGPEESLTPREEAQLADVVQSDG